MFFGCFIEMTSHKFASAMAQNAAAMRRNRRKGRAPASSAAPGGMNSAQIAAPPTAGRGPMDFCSPKLLQRVVVVPPLRTRPPHEAAPACNGSWADVGFLRKRRCSKKRGILEPEELIEREQFDTACRQTLRHSWTATFMSFRRGSKTGRSFGQHAVRSITVRQEVYVCQALLLDASLSMAFDTWIPGAPMTPRYSVAAMTKKTVPRSRI